MKFRRDTLKSRAVSGPAAAILLAKMANPLLAQHGLYLPRTSAIFALLLIPASQSLMVEYNVPDLPRSAPKIFNLFNIFLALTIALCLVGMSAYMDVFPMALSPVQAFAVVAGAFAGVSVSTDLAIWAYKRLLIKHGLSVTS